MGLDATVTLAVIFSFMSMIGTGVSIYAVLHNGQKENTDKEVEIIKRFTALEVKFDNFTSQVSSLGQIHSRFDERLSQLREESTKQNERIATLFRLYGEQNQRLSKLLGEENANGDSDRFIET